MGGRQMAQAGVRLVQDASEVAVVGIQEVLAHLPAIRRAMASLETLLREERPDLLVPIDFPDFNLRLASRARRARVDVVYFVSPQVWAWRKNRVHTIRRLVRRMLVLFPFETKIYDDAAVPVTFVGHPIAEQIAEPRSREELCAVAGLDPARQVVAVVPGSRRSEVQRLLTPMLRGADIVRRRRPGTQLLVTLAPHLDRAWFDERMAQAGVQEVRIHAADFPEILSACDTGVVASGTASLEAAVTGLPIVVGYKMGPLSYLVGRALVRLPHIALPNLVAGRGVVPELIQGQCNAERVAEELSSYFEHPERARRTRVLLSELRERLGGPGVYERAADAILGELPGR